MKIYISELIIKKYENSMAFKSGKSEGNMSISVYDKEKSIFNDPYKYENFKHAAMELEKENLIKIVWVSRNDTIDKISFNIKNIGQFYSYCNTKRKDSTIGIEINEIQNLKSKIQQKWMVKYLDSLIFEIETKKELPVVLKLKKEYLYNTLIGVNELILNNDNMLERLFSKKYLLNSKAFENNMRSTLISIIKRYCESVNPDMSNEDILNIMGIEKTSGDLYLKGNIVIGLNGEQIDLGKFMYGIGLNKATLKEVEILRCDFEKVISIENKANFIVESKESKENELIIFSAGFYSPLEKKFLLKLREYSEKSRMHLEYYHSGDFDLGGFNIFVFIKKNIFPDLLPYKMDKETYLSNIEFGEDIKSKEYKNKLSDKLKVIDYEEFHEVIKEIIKNNKILEQEALLF